MSVIGTLMQTGGAAACLVTAIVCAVKEKINLLGYDSEKCMLLPPEPYGKIALIAAAVLVLGFLLTVIGHIARKKILSVIGALFYGAVCAGTAVFFSLSFYGYTDIIPVINYTVEHGDDCDKVYADNTIVHICQVYLIHEGKAYRIEGCGSEGGIKRRYSASYNSNVFLPAYDIAITGDVGFRYKLVYTLEDEVRYYG